MLSTLVTFLERHNLTDNTEERHMVDECARLVLNVHSLFIEIARILRTSDPTRDYNNMLPPHMWNTLAFMRDTANVIVKGESKLTNFQNAILHVSNVLQGLQYRRADSKFYRRTFTRTGIETNAFEEVSTVRSFVSMQCASTTSYKLFQWTTDPKDNFEQLVKYMTDRVIPEVPDLVEDCHLRSYEGDSVGRGSGIYDCASDMFFPYIMRSEWSQLADLATRVRQRTHSSYKCEPPSNGVVCVLHLDCVFPFDIYGELLTLASTHVWSIWRNAEAFECVNGSFEESCSELVSYLADQLPPSHSKDEEVPGVIGSTWQLVTSNIDFPVANEEWREISLSDDTIAAQIGCGIIVPSKATVELFQEYITMNDYVAMEDDDGNCLYYVPLHTPPSRCRVVVPDDVMASCEILSDRVGRSTFLSCFKDGVKRFFRPYIGRTWLECSVNEIDHIYMCQKFDDHDKFMIYACKGRLFYEVGEFDTYETTLFFEGVGGCGKTTIMKAEQAFWPPHLRGILSPNMQPQFGMSSVCKKRVVFCNEVSADLSIVQEEWQTACSGEIGSYAVKFGSPIVMKWIAPMFWIGNGFPTKFKNLQGQVSRRLAGVLMAHPVTNRDGGIINRIYAKLGMLQRKQVLAYFEFVRIHGSTDPMSQPDKLPPAFADYFRKSKRATDPIEDFLSEGTFVKMDPTNRMLLSDFKELYGEYRIKYDLGRALRWGEATYRTAFNERGLFVVHEVSVRIDGVEHRNVDIVVGLAAVRE